MPRHAISANPPLVQVGVNVSEAMARRGRGGPLPDGLIALIDTGAARTAISAGVLARLSPRRVGEVEVRRADRVVEKRPTYAVRVAFAPDFGSETWPIKSRFFAINAVEAEPATPGVDILIGQDILAELTMIHDGPSGRLLIVY